MKNGPSTFLSVALCSFAIIPQLPAAAASNYALEFDGIDDRVQVGNIMSNVFNSFTIELWAYPTGYRLPTEETDGGISLIEQRFAVFPEHGDLSYGAGHAGAGLSIGTNGVSVYEHAADYLPSRLVYSYLLSGWTHVALVYSNKAPRLYVNGVLVRSKNVESSKTVHPGANLGAPLEWIGYGNYQGQLDEVRIWNAPLSQAQIVANMNRTLAGDEPNLVVYFRCDEGTGLALTDHAPANPSVNGALTDGTSWVPRTFTDIGAGLPGVGASSAAWGDYDNDGDLDILLTGFNGAPLSRVYRNNGNGTFTHLNAGLPGVYRSSVAWGDYDNDGDLDILLTGLTGSWPNEFRLTRVYSNNGNGTFTDINAGLPEVSDGSVAWGDFDNDGDLDILLTGRTGSLPNEFRLTSVYRNNGNGTFTDLNAGLPGVVHSSVALGDFDNDGDLDILLTGFTSSNAIAHVYRSNGDGSFTGGNTGLPGVAYGSVAWGDYDNDGDLDTLLTGDDGFSILPCLVYPNNGPFGVSILPDAVYSSVAWGDFDNDGDLDILLTGATHFNASESPLIAGVYRNNGNSTFTDVNAGLPGVYTSSVAWGDFDNDGDLDILLTGATFSDAVGYLPITRVYRNNGIFTNSPPNAPTNAPTGLTVAVNQGTATLSWNAVGAGLTYNVRVGTAPGRSDVLGPMASAGGVRRLPQMGNAQLGLTALLKYNAGAPYYWSVQAVNGAFAGSAFSAEANFRIHRIEESVITPAIVTNIPVGDLNGDGLVNQHELNTVLSNYFSNSPFLQMTNVAGLGGTNVTFALTNSLAGAFSVESTTNLMDWLFLGPATPRYEFTDTNAPAHPHRYYRLRWP